MKKKLLTLAAPGLMAVQPAVSMDPEARPNIILIVTDDLGHSDIGAWGGEIRTPNLDWLAKEGLRFTQFYNASKCEPSRASLLTGLYWPVTGLGGKRGITLGEALRGAGYATCALGKWHIDGNPVHRGFDRYFGHLSGASPFFPPLNNSWRVDTNPFTTDDPDFYVTDALTDFTIDFIRTNRRTAPEKPFFVYLGYNAPHNPLQAPHEDILRYRGSYLKGWDVLREERYQRMIGQGLIDPEATPLSPRPQNIPAWDSLTPEQKDLEDLRMSVYAAMIDRLDQNIGRLLDGLRAEGVAENTLILFLSDNGASPYWRTDRPMLAAGRLPGDRNSNWEIGLGWANAANTPFRLYKRNQHEGGILTPMIAWWPAGIRNGGRKVSDVSHIIDILPTLLDAGQGSYPAQSAGRANPPLPGKSLLPLFKDQTREPHHALYFLLYDHAAIRSGNWKLARVDGHPWELFDLSSDRTETRDLATEHPEITQRLERQFTTWLTEVNMQNYTNPTPPEDRRDDRGGGVPYVPSAMPNRLKDRLPLP